MVFLSIITNCRKLLIFAQIFQLFLLKIYYITISFITKILCQVDALLSHFYLFVNSNITVSEFFISDSKTVNVTCLKHCLAIIK